MPESRGITSDISCKQKLGRCECKETAALTSGKKVFSSFRDALHALSAAAFRSFAVSFQETALSSVMISARHIRRGMVKHIFVRGS